MNPIGRIAGINLAVLLIYSILIRAASSGQNPGKSMGILMLSAIAVAFHVLVCLFVTAIMHGNKAKGLARAWLLSAGIVLLVGFSVCLGNASL